MQDRIKEINERLEKITPGVWTGWGEGVYTDVKVRSQHCIDFQKQICDSDAIYCDHNEGEICRQENPDVTAEQNRNNMIFIGHARQDVPYLLDALEQAQKTIEELYHTIDALGVCAHQDGDRERILRDTLSEIVGMCESIGTFRNGVEYQGMDQGDVQAGECINRARQILNINIPINTVYTNIVKKSNNVV